MKPLFQATPAVLALTVLLAACGEKAPAPAPKVEAAKVTPAAPPPAIIKIGHVGRGCICYCQKNR
jgi:predicted small lipoprotein YifL